MGRGRRLTTRADDLGRALPAGGRVAGPVRRVVSLVPSLTEAIASVQPQSLVGVTDWCTHPAGLEAARIRGTKNPDCAAIAALSPDLVIANKEENRRIDVDRLASAGVPVWVTDIESIDMAFASMRRLFEVALEWQVPEWLGQAEAEWSQPPRLSGLRAAVAIWRDPWMAVGSRTFTGDLLARLGLEHAFAGHAERYPAMSLDALDDAGLDLVLLPDEPYPFGAGDGPEAFARTRTVLVEGRLLTWYGPSLLGARRTLESEIERQLRT